MKTKIRIMAPCFAVLCLGLASEARAGDPASDPLPCHDEVISPSTTLSEGMPVRFNRASGIVGMAVRNQAGQHLGRIKDLVFDLNTERVSYAVVSARPKNWFRLNEKLLAVPLNALTASTDRQHLILNADKSQVETAMGFDPNHWPSVISPSWGAEPFWLKDNQESEMRDTSGEHAAKIHRPDKQSPPVKTAPSTSPALDDRPGGLAWPGY